MIAFPIALFKAYKQRVRDTAPIGYWPLDELSGGTAIDLSGNGRNGAHTGVTLLQPGMGDGGTSPLYDGVNDYTNIYSAGLAGAFSKDEGSVAVWAKVAGAGVWTDATNRRIIHLRTDVSNRLLIGRPTASNLLQFLYVAGGTTKTVNLTTSAVDWLHVVLTWSKATDQMKAYAAGAQTGTTQTALGTWVGALNSTNSNIGSTDTTPNAVWSGTLAHAAIWTRVLTAAEIAELAKVH